VCHQTADRRGSRASRPVGRAPTGQ
jgi:hypothetical protein